MGNYEDEDPEEVWIPTMKDGHQGAHWAFVDVLRINVDIGNRNNH